MRGSYGFAWYIYLEDFVKERQYVHASRRRSLSKDTTCFRHADAHTPMRRP